MNVLLSGGPASGYKDTNPVIKRSRGRTYIIVRLNETDYRYEPSGKRAIEMGLSFAEYIFVR